MTSTSAQTLPAAPIVPEHLYQGELAKYPGAWAFGLPRASIILVRDQDLDDLMDPDKEVDLSLTHDKNITTLRRICEQLRAAGGRTIVVAYDQFFNQYRPGQETQRRYTPDSPEFIERIGKLSDFAEQYGLGLELSLLSPLEIGQAWWRQTQQPAIWMHYRKGVRDPQTGDFSVGLWRQTAWTNNKGRNPVYDAGVRVFAFREVNAPGPVQYVDPNSIVELTTGTQVKELPGTASGSSMRVVVTGGGRADLPELNRVLVVQHYRVDEMDYFSPDALPFLNGLIDRYTDAGVQLNALYSDEMHIQQDWGYHHHHDNGQFAVRYMSPHMAARFAERYGEQYRDFAKWMIYFCYGQDDQRPDVRATEPLGIVWDPSPVGVQAAALFRARYYHLLQDEVVNLFTAAKRHAEQRMGHQLESRAHATWAQSPTCDVIAAEPQAAFQNMYEYTPMYRWSNTVQQAAAACADYFKWGEYLTGNGTDHPEGGWLDRNYYGLALSASLGMLNSTPNAYCADWGHPGEVTHRRQALVAAYGSGHGASLTSVVQELRHRDANVLMLYPLDLVATDERFGSWMSQYGYANLITADKLIERGRIAPGGIEIDEAGGVTRRFTTLVVQFEPFPPAALLDQMTRLAEAGGRVIWSGPPPVLTREGGDALTPWQALFGVQFAPIASRGYRGPGRLIQFEGALSPVTTMTVLTDYSVDYLYPVTPGGECEVVARSQCGVVGTRRPLSSGGQALFLGFRPRDDQSASLGYETRTWFEILDALGAYPGTGKFPGINDNTEYLSRTTPYLVTRFPNGAVAVAPHLRDLPESWPGGFARDGKEDAEIVQRLNLPPHVVQLKDFKVNGWSVDYDGAYVLLFRADAEGRPLAFSGIGQQITINGRTTAFADRQCVAIWAPIAEDRRTTAGALLLARCSDPLELRIPAPHLPATVQAFAEGAAPGSKGEPVAARRDGETLILTLTPTTINRWIYILPG